jgi:hypothetical protein
MKCLCNKNFNLAGLNYRSGNTYTYRVFRGRDIIYYHLWTNGEPEYGSSVRDLWYKLSSEEFGEHFSSAQDIRRRKLDKVKIVSGKFLSK